MKHSLEVKQDAEWGMIHAQGGNKQHPSHGSDMDAALARGGAGKKNCDFFGRTHFWKGMQLKINMFFAFFFCGRDLIIFTNT